MTPDIGLAAIQYDRVLAAGLARRIGAGQQSLGRRLFIAGGPVDLAGEEEARESACTSRLRVSSRGST